MEDVRMKLSPPWITFINELKALFDGDPEIAFNINSTPAKNPSVTIACNNGDKNAALIRLLPEYKAFGNVYLDIFIDGTIANREFVSTKELFDVAFEKNPAYAYTVTPSDEGIWFFDFTYVVFKNCVVQFFNDNLDDAHGVISTLYQEIAKDVFADAEIPGRAYYCTDIEQGKLGKPLGEWP